MDLVITNFGPVCPTSHPFAFADGDYCCLTNFDAHGNMLAYNGRTGCQNQNSVPCNNKPCISAGRIEWNIMSRFYNLYIKYRKNVRIYK